LYVYVKEEKLWSKRSFVRYDVLLSVCFRSKGIKFTAIDWNKPLSEQGPFDVILHKVGDSFFLCIRAMIHIQRSDEVLAWSFHDASNNSLLFLVIAADFSGVMAQATACKQSCQLFVRCRCEVLDLNIKALSIIVAVPGIRIRCSRMDISWNILLEIGFLLSSSFAPLMGFCLSEGLGL
jgi:hypothetical protein